MQLRWAGPRQDCTALKAALDDNSMNSGTAVASFVAAGVGAAALATTWLLWKPSGERIETAIVAPMIGPRAASVVMNWSY